MSADSVDLPFSSTVNGKLIITENVLFSNFLIYSGLMVLLIVVIIMGVIVTYKRDLRLLRENLLEKFSKKVKFGILNERQKSK